MRFISLLRFGFVFMGVFREGVELTLGSGSDSAVNWVLAGSTSGPLAGDHYSLEEELTTPDAPGLTPFECAGEAKSLDRAFLAQGLGVLHVAGQLGEEQLRVVDPTRQQFVFDSVRCVVQSAEAYFAVTVENADIHVSPPSDLDRWIAGVRSNKLCK
jgi:hypothetical protein